MKRHKSMSKNMTFGANLLHPVMMTGFTGSLPICVRSLKIFFKEEANKNY